MNSNRISFLFWATIFSTLFFNLTLKFTDLVNTTSVCVFIMYITLFYLAIKSFYGIIIRRSLKENLFGTLSGITGIILIFSFIVGYFGSIEGNIVIITFYIAFVTFFVFCGLWGEYKKKQ